MAYLHQAYQLAQMYDVISHDHFRYGEGLCVLAHNLLSLSLLYQDSMYKEQTLRNECLLYPIH